MQEIWSIVLGLLDGAILAPVFYGMAIVACLYTLFSIVSLRRFTRRRDTVALADFPGVTILKPLHGVEPGLAGHLASFCQQDYAGPVQIVFGVQSANDPAIGVARKVIQTLRSSENQPGARAAEMIVDAEEHGANRKVSNLINLSRRIEHDIVILADSDIIVQPDYVRRLVATLGQPEVGLVTCLYSGQPMAGFWSGLCAMGVDYSFLPNVLVGLALRLARPCIGATIALRRATLEAIGGFSAVADHLADDFALGEAVRATGQKIALADFTVGHVHAEGTFGQLWRQETRWARTIRSLDPLGYAGMAITYPVAWALLALVSGGFEEAGSLLAFAAVLCRLTLQDEIEQRLTGRSHSLWLMPARDVLSFLVFLAAFAPGRVSWRGRAFGVSQNGMLIPVKSEENEAGVIG